MKKHKNYIAISLFVVCLLLFLAILYVRSIPLRYDPKRLDLTIESSRKEHDKIYLEYCREKITRRIIQEFDSLNKDNYLMFIEKLEAIPPKSEHINGTRAWIITMIYHHFGDERNALAQLQKLYDMDIRTYCYRPVINEKSFILDLGDIMFLNKPESLLGEMYIYDSMNNKRKAVSKAWKLLDNYGQYAFGYRTSQLEWSYGQKASLYLANNIKRITKYKVTEVSSSEMKLAGEKFVDIILRGDTDQLIGFFKSGNMEYPYSEAGFTTTYSRPELIFLLKYKRGDIYAWYKRSRDWFKNSYSGNILLGQNNLVKFIGKNAGDQKLVQFGLERGKYKIFSMGE